MIVTKGCYVIQEEIAYVVTNVGLVTLRFCTIGLQKRKWKNKKRSIF
jgi:hypothetical protein